MVTPKLRSRRSASPGRPQGRRALSLIEVLVASFILAVLGLTLQGSMTGVLRGVRGDRLTEAKRHMVLDLLERFAHSYSDIHSLFDENPATTATRVLDLEETMNVVAIPDEEKSLLRGILESGNVKGFNLVWHRGKRKGVGDPNRALRLDVLWVFPVVSMKHPGPSVDSFRVFNLRGIY